MKAKETARVTTVVAVDPATAFSVFTEEIGAWWRHKIRDLFREGRVGVMKFEPGPNGRLLETYADAPDDPFEVGRVLSWIPGERLVFEWRQRGFGTNDVTEVDVRFEAVSYRNSCHTRASGMGHDFRQSIPHVMDGRGKRS